MKRILSVTGRMIVGLCVAGVMLIAKPAIGAVVKTSPQAIIVSENQTEPKAAIAPTAPVPPKRVLKIESVERVNAEESRKEITWLGIYTEETTEALGAQLGLKSGEGLLITFVAPESPASKASLQKNDVLVELEDQLLVHPAQLAKLIRSRKDGETIKLTFYRQGKKQTVSAKLGTKTEALGWMPAPAMPMPANIAWQASTTAAVNEQVKSMHESLLHVEADRERIQMEVERSIEEACKTLAESLQGKAQAIAFGADAKDWEHFAHAGVNIGNDATVVVKKDGSSVKTIVKTDETGVYILLANPQKRLTIYDKEGKLLFNDEIESKEQQEKIPADMRKKVDPMLQQLDSAAGKKPKPSAQYWIELKT